MVFLASKFEGQDGWLSASQPCLIKLSGPSDLVRLKPVGLHELMSTGTRDFAGDCRHNHKAPESES